MKRLNQPKVLAVSPENSFIIFILFAVSFPYFHAQHSNDYLADSITLDPLNLNSQQEKAHGDR